MTLGGFERGKRCRKEMKKSGEIGMKGKIQTKLKQKFDEFVQERAIRYSQEMKSEGKVAGSKACYSTSKEQLFTPQRTASTGLINLGDFNASNPSITSKEPWFHNKNKTVSNLKYWGLKKYKFKRVAKSKNSDLKIHGLKMAHENFNATGSFPKCINIKCFIEPGKTPQKTVSYNKKYIKLK